MKLGSNVVVDPSRFKYYILCKQIFFGEKNKIWKIELRDDLLNRYYIFIHNN